MFGNSIQAGVPAGITRNELTHDIEMLLNHSHTDLPELRAICNAVTKVDTEINGLYELIEKHLPHKTNGGCNGLGIPGKNRLLDMLFAIQDTSVEFQGGVDQVRRSCEKILHGKEQQVLFG